MKDYNTQAEIDHGLKQMRLECEIENHGVSEEEIHDELVNLGDFFYDAINTDEVREKWENVACLPVCELSADSSNRLLIDYAITANRWINAVCAVMAENMGTDR